MCLCLKFLRFNFPEHTAGVNDQREHAEELATLLHHWKLGNHVNIIPYNPISDSEFERPTKAKVCMFLNLQSNSYLCFRPKYWAISCDALGQDGFCITCNR